MADNLTAGGNGVDGTLKLLGADGKTLLEARITDRPTTIDSSELTLGATNRVGVLSLLNKDAVRSVRVDGEMGSVNLGSAATGSISMSPRQIIMTGDNGAEQFTALAHKDRSDASVGAQDRPGRFSVHGKTASVTGAPLEFTGTDGQLRLGRSGTNGGITLYSADAKERILIRGVNGSIQAGGNSTNGSLSLLAAIGSQRIGLNAADAAIRAGGAGANGQVALSSGEGQQRVSLNGGDGTVRVGGNGVHGRVSVFGADNQPVVELFGTPTESLIGIGRADRPARMSMFGPKGEMVRLDGANGDIALLNADCAEEFDVHSDDVKPGTVMAVTDDGSLAPAEKPYDNRVAGVVSGAGSYRPGVILDRRDTGRPRAPIALMGKVYCLADAGSAPIRAGDLLTTGDLPGHAMKAVDAPTGTVLGKALGALDAGTGLIPVLVMSA